MSTHKLLDALNDVDERYLEEALGKDGKAQPERSARIWKIGGICAAAAALGLAAMFAVPKLLEIRQAAKPTDPLVSEITKSEIPSLAEVCSLDQQQALLSLSPYTIREIRAAWGEGEPFKFFSMQCEHWTWNDRFVMVRYNSMGNPTGVYLDDLEEAKSMLYVYELNVVVNQQKTFAGLRQRLLTLDTDKQIHSIQAVSADGTEAAYAAINPDPNVYVEADKMSHNALADFPLRDLPKGSSIRFYMNDRQVHIVPIGETIGEPAELPPTDPNGTPVESSAAEPLLPPEESSAAEPLSPPEESSVQSRVPSLRMIADASEEDALRAIKDIPISDLVLVWGEGESVNLESSEGIYYRWRVANKTVTVNFRNTYPVSVEIRTVSDPDGNVPFTVTKLRTVWTEEAYPRTGWATNTAALQPYIERDADPFEGFDADAFEGFDAAFFAEHNLIVVEIEETSGSNQVTVTRVSALQNGAKTTVEIGLERNIPAAGTCDMARWLFLIAVDKSYGPDTCDLKLAINTIRETLPWEQ